ncbi:TssQ family T6SS-associated lipoprotein [Massilia sp. DJPM01]|uniref:TssQ family T6SS-associated lipoprotein n=1 Tax=Massilia sp. DJPM01 TaxID=3024404 RepID=UPI00259ECA48|nr:TssQ family T6SS-associated lipoprotein [Massilia sp. DJPM01]MDM5175702.1 TssQ family T6SS-associated lipoprotein [Massilia sp. DJPM01]
MNRILNARPPVSMLRTAVFKAGASVLAISAPLWLSACASTDSAPVAAPEPAARPAAVILNAMEQRAQVVIAEANKQFTAGDFKAVIVNLNTSKAIDFSSTATQVQAHKLLAFSYCITKKTAPCNAEAERVMLLDPGFQLPEAERSHPMWGPAFDAARKKVTLPAKP